MTSHLRALFGARAVEPFHSLRLLIAALDRSGDEGLDVLYLGDSVVHRVSSGDQDRRGLGDMVVDRLGAEGLSATWIAHTGYHPEVFELLIAAAVASSHQPQTLLLPVNMRCFSAQWFSHPRWRSEEHLDAIRRFLGDPTEVATAVPVAAPTRAALRRYRRASLDGPLSPGATVAQLEAVRAWRPATDEEWSRRTGLLLIYHYGYVLRQSHPWLLALRSAIAQAASAGISVAVYATPVNVAAMQRHVGDGLTRLLRDNVGVVQDALCSFAGVPFWDLSSTLDSSGFFHENDPTEHLNEHGRTMLVAELEERGFMAFARRNRA